MACTAAMTERHRDADLGRALAEITEECAALILPLWRSGLTVHSKADQSPVTEADRRGEALILERLAQRFPGVHVVSEEDASEFGTPEEVGSRFFLVDPLDGTKAFIRGDAHFTVNIGLIEAGRPIAGAVTAPATGQSWFTTQAGAVRRELAGPDEVIRARAWPNGKAVALVSHTLKPEYLEALIARYGFDEKQPMDSSIKLCMIAQGSADIYPRHGTTMEWDIAAGHAVLEAAGGRLTSLDGDAFDYGKASAGFKNGWFVARGA
jgi:3'(2'), 5'-bisphosphate nucleotidase